MTRPWILAIILLTSVACKTGMEGDPAASPQVNQVQGVQQDAFAGSDAGTGTASIDSPPANVSPPVEPTQQNGAQQQPLVASYVRIVKGTRQELEAELAKLQTNLERVSQSIESARSSIAFLESEKRKAMQLTYNTSMPASQRGEIKARQEAIESEWDARIEKAQSEFRNALTRQDTYKNGIEVLEYEIAKLDYPMSIKLYQDGTYLFAEGSGASQGKYETTENVLTLQPSMTWTPDAVARITVEWNLQRTNGGARLEYRSGFLSDFFEAK